MLTINNDNKSSFLLTYRPCWTLMLRKHFPQQPLPRATLDVIESARAHARLCSAKSSALWAVSLRCYNTAHELQWPRDSSVRESFICLRWKYINCYVVTQVGAWEAVEAKWQRCGIIGSDFNLSAQTANWIAFTREVHTSSTEAHFQTQLFSS